MTQEFFLPGGQIGVLLIHGLAGTPNEMRRLGRDLQHAGFTVLGTQLAGHCGSRDDLLGTNWRDWFASVEASAELLHQSVDHVFVGGLSMGAILSLLYAIEHPNKVTGLALYGTTFFYDGWAIPLSRHLSFLLPIFDQLGIGRNNNFVETPPFGIKNPRIRRAVLASMLKGDSTVAGLLGSPWPSLAEFNCLSRHVRRQLSRVCAPCLVVHAQEDDVASLKNVQLLERRITSPIEKLVLEDSYHMVTIDQQRGLVAKQSADFFYRMIDHKKYIP